jgi:hypothetical protein
MIERVVMIIIKVEMRNPTENELMTLRKALSALGGDVPTNVLNIKGFTIKDPIKPESHYPNLFTAKGVNNANYR